MRVALVSTWEVDCGIATYTRALRERLLGEGIECDVIPIDRTEVKYLARSELRPHFARLADRIEGYDLVHLQHEHGFFGGAQSIPTSVSVTRSFLARLARRGVPVVVTFHTEPIDPFGRAGLWAVSVGTSQRAHWRATLGVTFRRHRNLSAIVHTRSSRRALADWGMPTDSISVIPHGIELPEGPPPTDEERAAARERLGFAPDAVVLSQFGFLAGYKGVTASARAIRHLPERFHLAVLGDTHPHGGDDTLERILETFEEPGPGGGAPDPLVRERVRLEGWLPPERFADWRAATSIALAPYHPVPGFSFSGALTWSIAAGVPVIASRIPPFIELQEQADCLVLVSPEAPRELAHRVQQLEADPDRRARLADAARRHAEQASWESVARRHAEVYERSVRDQAAASRTSPSTSFRSTSSASATDGSSSSHDGAERSRSAMSRR